MNSSAVEDRETISRVLAGNYDAFERLVEKYQGRIYRHLIKMVRDAHVAEDLLQETFLNSYKGLAQFEGGSSFSTWIFRIATNNALMFLRKHRPESVEYNDSVRDEFAYPFLVISPELVDTPLSLLLSKEGRAKIEEAIDALPTIYRTVLILRDVEGFTVEEVSQVLSSSVSAVKSRLHRARASLRRTLLSYYVETDLLPSRGNS